MWLIILHSKQFEETFERLTVEKSQRNTDKRGDPVHPSMIHIKYLVSLSLGFWWSKKIWGRQSVRERGAGATNHYPHQLPVSLSLLNPPINSLLMNPVLCSAHKSLLLIEFILTDWSNQTKKLDEKVRVHSVWLLCCAFCLTTLRRSLALR